MVEEEQDYSQNYLAEMGTRLRDLESKVESVRDRILMLGRNFLNIKETLDEDIGNLKKENKFLNQKIKSIEKNTKNILLELNKTVRRDEIILVERMLKDFQPLNFVRKEDLSNLIKNTKEIKTKKTIQ